MISAMRLRLITAPFVMATVSPGLNAFSCSLRSPLSCRPKSRGVVHRAPQKVGSALVDGLLQCDGIGRKRIGGSDRVEGLAPEEFDHVQVVARRAVDLRGGFVPPVFRSKESIDIERIRPMTPFLGAKPRISRTLLGRPIVSALCGRKAAPWAREPPAWRARLKRGRSAVRAKPPNACPSRGSPRRGPSGRGLR